MPLPYYQLPLDVNISDVYSKQRGDRVFTSPTCHSHYHPPI